MKRWILTLLLIVLIPAVCTFTEAKAQENEGTSSSGFGLRAGFGIDPDQFVIGGQYTLPNRFGPMRIVPSVDLGFGDNVTTILFNGDVIFSLAVEGTRFRLYGGGGVVLAYLDPEGRGSDWKVGLDLVAGTSVPIFKERTTNIEARFGITDNIPDFRLLFVLVF